MVNPYNAFNPFAGSGPTSQQANMDAQRKAAQMANLDKRFLPAQERMYYALPAAERAKYGMGTADQRSESRAATRGAQYAQERRINQIRSKNGINEAFNPAEDQPGLPDANSQAFLNRDLNLAQGVPLDQTMGMLPDKSISNYRMADSYLGSALQAAGQPSQDEIAAQMATLQPYLQTRYTNDAVNAGTLTTSPQSQGALNADVSAGMQGAQDAMQNNSALYQSALSPSFAQNPNLFPSATNTSTLAANPAAEDTPGPAPTAENAPPENALSATGVASSQSSMSPANRAQQIQMKRSQAQKGTNL